MSISHRTNRLKLVGQPSVEQLQNGRYRLTVNCTALNTRNDWYNANKDRIFPDFGSLQSAEMSIDGLAPREGEAYTDMRLTKVESGNRSMRDGGDYLVVLTYETLGSAFVQVKDDTTDYELNGLRRVTRTSIAEAGTDYTKTVGTSFIDHQINSETAVRCYLASYSVDDNDSFRQVQEVYVEAGILSETLDKVGSQKAKVIETIGTDPATPDGYVLASKRESDFEGFQTNQFTFLKPSIISVRQDLNNGEKLVNVQAFDKTSTQVSELLSEVTDSHTLISQSESEYDGIKTSTYVYEIDSSYKEEYEVNGFRRIILKELSTDPLTAAAIGSAAPITSPAVGLFLASQRIDNGGVIKVRETVWIEAGVISITPMEEDGFSLAASYVYVTTNAPASSMTGLITPNGDTLPSSVTWYEPSIQNVEGYPTYTQKVILKIVPATPAGVLVHETDKFFTVTEPGIMDCDGAFSQSAKSGAAARYPVARSVPETYRKKGTVKVYLTTSSQITETEVAFSEKDTQWCSITFWDFYTSEKGQAASASGSWRSFPNYLKGTTDGTAYATLLGEYAAYATSLGKGSETYNMAGIYRVALDKYTRDADGTQLYLKTIVTF